MEVLYVTCHERNIGVREV